MAADTPPRSPPEPIVEARRLTKSFRGHVAVKSVDLKIRQGDIHALIGPNGAGKTTVFNLLTKFIAPTEGEIYFRGQRITRESPTAVARRGIVRSFQISAIFQNLSVLENILMSLQRRHVSARRFWISAAGIAPLRERARAILELVDLGPYAQTRAGDLPYGHKRALELATTLAADPVVMLLDEPTQGLGFEEVDRITDLIKRLAAERTILMVEHNMKMVARIADRITVLRYGEIIAEGTYEEMAVHPQVIEAYLGSRGQKRQVRHERA